MKGSSGVPIVETARTVSQVYLFGVILYAPNAAPLMAANIIKSSINQQKEQRVQLQMSQQMLSQVGSCVHFFHA